MLVKFNSIHLDSNRCNSTRFIEFNSIRGAASPAPLAEMRRQQLWQRSGAGALALVDVKDMNNMNDMNDVNDTNTSIDIYYIHVE